MYSLTPSGTLQLYIHKEIHNIALFCFVLLYDHVCMCTCALRVYVIMHMCVSVGELFTKIAIL